MSDSQTERIYIVISQPGTIVANILRLVTGKAYNHVSLGLKSDLKYMYSFGRLNAYNPFNGGFVTESAEFGTFKRFIEKAEIIVLDLEIEKEKYDNICFLIEKMCLEKKKYHYNYLGVFLAAFNIEYQAKNHFYCSEFVRHILLRHGIEGAECLNPIIQPMHFLQIANSNLIYKGKLKDYSYSFETIIK